MFAALFANGAPAPYPEAASSPLEWAVWGACMSLAALLGGWALRNANRPSRDTLVGLALLFALILGGAATMFAVSRNYKRHMEQDRKEYQQREQELREPTEPPAPSR
jgi:hypothetical protein